VRISLFWRTFALIALVVVVSVLAWFQLFRAAERQPRAERFAWEVASVVNLTRAGLLSASPESRPELLADLARDEGVRVLPLEPVDRVEPWPDRRLGSLIEIKLRELLGPPSRIAGSVNGERGLWISFDIEGDPYWLLLDAARLDRQANRDWLGWLGIALLLALLGALAISRVVNRPLAQLAGAIDRLSRGEPAPRLKEDAPTEIAEVNRRFNRMAADLAALDVDRAEALAGISHDIRTPLTRLRMEIELSPLGSREKDSMGEEIERIDDIVRQFVDFARPAEAGAARRVDVAATVDAVLDGFRSGHGADGLSVVVDVPADLGWTGQPTALARILANLLENARRYGCTPGTSRAEVAVRARRHGRELQLAVRDHGPGVPPDQLERLTRPFTRLDDERNRHGGAGLGLAVVARLAHRYGGELTLELPVDGGLLAVVRMRDDAVAGGP
jgi:two-component system, OmpR family, osmolarity sensor histidine kinase EnvZ